MIPSAHKYPVGVSDYRELVEDGYFHWDRTLFVKEFFESDAKVLGVQAVFAIYLLIALDRRHSFFDRVGGGKRSQ